MASLIAALLYLILILIVGTLSAFIVYHLYVYSIHKKAAVLLSGIFIVVLVIIFLLNILFFVAADFNSLEIGPSTQGLPGGGGGGRATF